MIKPLVKDLFISFLIAIGVYIIFRSWEVCLIIGIAYFLYALRWVVFDYRRNQSKPNSDFKKG